MRSRASHTVKLKPADPFDLIRWLARSQSYPRKAMAELVQNSIDAHARTVRIERRSARTLPGPRPRTSRTGSELCRDSGG